MQLDPRMVMDSGSMQLDPRMLMDPSMQLQNQIDPRMLMQQMGPQQIDPRALFGPGFGMNQNLMSSPPFLVDRRMDPFMGPPMGGMPMKRGGGDFMMPPNYDAGMPYMPQAGPGPMMMDPRLQSMYAPMPYGFFPQGVALPFTQQDWRPPMPFPDELTFSEQGFPVIEAPVNESADMGDGAMMRELLGETVETQSANGASGPTSPNKKDQEYRSLLPSDESQDRVLEDVTVTVVKGSAEKPVPSGEMTGTVVGDSSDEEANGQDDDYVFMITDPQ